ncbi:MAG: SRPBCC family protein [Planctomycetota bacterium]
METPNTDSIVKHVTLAASPTRIRKAIANSDEFGQCFGVNLQGTFRVGETTGGMITHTGCEHLTFHVTVTRMEPECLLAFRWSPYAVEPATFDSESPTTLVEFRVEPAGSGTHLTITESGFDALPAEHRSECFLRNEDGWAVQIHNVQHHVDG